MLSDSTTEAAERTHGNVRIMDCQGYAQVWMAGNVHTGNLSNVLQIQYQPSYALANPVTFGSYLVTKVTMSRIMKEPFSRCNLSSRLHDLAAT